MIHVFILTIGLLPILSDFALGQGSHPSSAVVNSNITESEVVLAQQNWGKALLKISEEFDSKGIKEAKAVANRIIDDAYGYNFGSVLFKPTLAFGDHTFRTTKDGAISYFVGNDEKFPDDKGFALKGWKKYSVENASIQIHGNVALTMGNVILTDKLGKQVKVDKTWGFRKDENGTVRIILHHSSLPYSP